MQIKVSVLGCFTLGIEMPGYLQAADSSRDFKEGKTLAQIISLCNSDRFEKKIYVLSKLEKNWFESFNSFP